MGSRMRAGYLSKLHTPKREFDAQNCVFVIYVMKRMQGERRACRAHEQFFSPAHLDPNAVYDCPERGTYKHTRAPSATDVAGRRQKL